VATKFFRWRLILWVLSTDRAVCHPYGAQNFEMFILDYIFS